MNRPIGRFERPFLALTSMLEQQGQWDHVALLEGLVRFKGKVFLYFRCIEPMAGILAYVIRMWRNLW